MNTPEAVNRGRIRFMPRFITVARACTREAGMPTRRMGPMMAPSGRKPRKDRRTRLFRRTMTSPTVMPTS